MKPFAPLLLTLALTSLLFSCGRKEELVEVEIPDAPFMQDETAASSSKDVVAKEGAFKMTSLNFEYADLDPYMDSKTIETHYGKIHLDYLNKFNDLVKGTDLESKSIEEVLKTLDPQKSQLKFNAGGFYNHNLFWSILSKTQGGKPNGKIAELINRDFGTFDTFKSQYRKAATDLNGSGWVWLIIQDNGTLKITTTANENNPLMPYEENRGYPLMNLDMWEHAYFLKFKDNKSAYIDNYFKLVDWNKVNYRIDLHNN